MDDFFEIHPTFLKDYSYVTIQSKKNERRIRRPDSPLNEDGKTYTIIDGFSRKPYTYEVRDFEGMSFYKAPDKNIYIYIDNEKLSEIINIDDSYVITEQYSIIFSITYRELNSIVFGDFKVNIFDNFWHIDRGTIYGKESEDIKEKILNLIRRIMPNTKVIEK